jgi:ferrous iron transport protein B
VRIALIGQPNVGKSVVFGRLTGIGIVSSNYPGTTVEFQEGKVRRGGQEFIFTDLPGIYSLSGDSDDEIVATRLLAETDPDRVVVIADASRLEQGLVLIFQLIEMGFRVVVSLNMMDVARKRCDIDITKLEEILRVPVIPTVAITGEGIEDLLDTLATTEVSLSPFKVRYDRHIETILEDLGSKLDSKSLRFPARGATLKLLEGNRFFVEQFPPGFLEEAEEKAHDFEAEHGEGIEVHINRDRYGEAGRVAGQVVSNQVRPRRRAELISDLTLRPLTGIPILLAVLMGVFLTIVFLGGLLESVLLSGYGALTSGFFTQLGALIGGNIGSAIASGIDLSFQAILSIVIPYIIVFYLILGILEDSGYLPRIIVLLDGIMRRIGLNGRAIIPMVVGMGCNVPAILATRVMESRRERLMVAVVTIMAIPCSAQTAVIIGTVGRFAGLGYAALVYIVLLAILLLLGKLLHHIMRYEPSSLAIEIPDLVLPRPRNVLWKTWFRAKDFFVVAFPILLVGSLVLELLMKFGVLATLVGPLAPFTVGFLGLPAIIIVALIFGILRKEMSLQLLVVLFGTATLSDVLSPAQLFIFALIMATYMPCLSAFAIMRREFGWKDTLKVTAASISLAFVLGGAAHFIIGIL